MRIELKLVQNTKSKIEKEWNDEIKNYNSKRKSFPYSICGETVHVEVFREKV